jgi:phosphatidylserine decarboxylase
MGNGYLIMILCSLIARVSQQENINFLLANRIPRQLATRFIGWFSKIEQLVIRDLSIGIWCHRCRSTQIDR